jgi:hypothetical protein
MTTLYHIHVSCLCSDPFEEIFWQQGYWSLILTNNVNEVIDVTNKMNSELRNDMRGTSRARDYQAVIAIVKINHECDDHVTLQQLCQEYPPVSLGDLCFDEPDTEVSKYAIYHDSCYRDDTNKNNDDNDNDDNDDDNDDNDDNENDDNDDDNNGNDDNDNDDNDNDDNDDNDDNIDNCNK